MVENVRYMIVSYAMHISIIKVIYIFFLLVLSPNEYIASAQFETRKGWMKNHLVIS